MVKNKAFNQSGKLRVNIGNIYVEQKKYSQAIKMYRMALDQISNSKQMYTHKVLLFSPSLIPKNYYKLEIKTIANIKF